MAADRFSAGDSPTRKKAGATRSRARARANGRPASRTAGPDARAVAIDILIDVLDRHKALDRTLDTHRGLASLDDRDRRFAHRLVLATIRHLGEIDTTIRSMLPRPLPDRAGYARMILRAGLAQLLVLKTPAHATVDTAVRLARGGKQENYASLINAALRRAAREAEAGPAADWPPEVNTPAWLWTRWVSAYGIEGARSIARAHRDEPPLDIVVKADPQHWAKLLDAEILPTGVLRRPSGGKIPGLPGYAEGAWWVQDLAASLPARLLGVRRGQKIIDLCAAPGGKAAQLCMAGGLVTAVEQSPERAKRLRENLTRLSFDAEIVVADALKWAPGFLADAVLLDAPCTATGTIRRHPDVAWTKRPSDIASLSTIQANLLRAAASMVAPGGCLVYCACSLEPEECRDQAVSFLASDPAFSTEAIKPEEVGELAEAIDADGWLRTLPYHLAERGGMDGFFAARFRRRARSYSRFTA